MGDPGGSGRLDLAGEPPVSVARLVFRFALVALVAAVAVAVGVSVATGRAAQDTAINEARQAAVVSGKGIVEPLVTDGVLAGDPAALARLDAVVRGTVLQGSLVRVKVWDADGRIAYSDEPRLIGARFPLDDEELTVLRNGGVEADASDLSKPENRYEEGDELLEVYLPIGTPSGTPLLFEAYFQSSGVTAARQSLWRRFAPISLGGLLVVELVQLPVAWSMAQRLRRQQAQRERLLRHAVDASQAERRRIAGDIHDGVVQDLAGVSLSLAAALRRPPGQPIDDEVVRQAAASVRRSVDGLRSLLIEIFPPDLAQEGLGSALADLVETMQRSGLETEIDVQLPTTEVPIQAASLLYRGAQESLRNVAAHAGATRVALSVRTSDGVMVLHVDDDGRGFSVQDVAQRGGEGHLGLRALEALCRDAGGSLSVRSGPDRGTLVEMRVPVR